MDLAMIADDFMKAVPILWGIYQSLRGSGLSHDTALEKMRSLDPEFAKQDADADAELDALPKG